MRELYQSYLRYFINCEMCPHRILIKISKSNFKYKKLTLQFDNYNNEKLSYQLYDMQSKLLNTEQVTTHQTQIN